MIIQEMLAPISNARSGKLRIGFTGVTVHETGNTKKGSGAINHAKYLQGSGSNNSASWHYCVDDKAITRSIPESEVAWHSGTTNGNYRTVSIEICVNEDCNFKNAVENAAWLCADILKRNKITKDVYKKYIFQHYDWSGKNCPQRLRSGKPLNWSYFVEKVGLHLEDVKSPSEELRVGSKAILNGYVYVDSYASKKGKLYKDKKVTISRYVKGRKAPYLVDNGLGWCRKEDLKI